MPKQKPGNSKQDYGTPKDLIAAIEKRFGFLSVDLAARKDNAICPDFVTPEEDSLSVDWRKFGGTAWLNPPYAKIAPWARKCAASAGPHLRILMLVPAAVGSNWYAEHVHGKAMVFALSPRITFVGESMPYVKDVILAAYGFGVTGFDLWRWSGKARL
jgi:phage N-6-adenine-methyltransferase